jgi:hypothetical protein
MNWTRQLGRGIEEALKLSGSHSVAVYTVEQKEKGEEYARNLARQVSGDPTTITFVIIPESEEGIIDIGTVDPPNYMVDRATA